MLIKSNVKMDSTIPTIPLKNGIARIVNASLITQLPTLFVRRRAANVCVRKTMTTELATNAQMVTLVILIANLVSVNLVTQLKLYVIKLMEHAGVWTNSMEADVMFVKVNTLDILIAMIVHADKTAPKIIPTFVT